MNTEMSNVMDHPLMRLAQGEIASYEDVKCQELKNYLWGRSAPKFKFALSVRVPRVNRSRSHPLLSALRDLSYTKRADNGLRLIIEDQSMRFGPYHDHKHIIVRLGY